MALKSKVVEQLKTDLRQKIAAEIIDDLIFIKNIKVKRSFTVNNYP